MLLQGADELPYNDTIVTKKAEAYKMMSFLFFDIRDV